MFCNKIFEKKKRSKQKEKKKDFPKNKSFLFFCACMLGTELKTKRVFFSKLFFQGLFTPKMRKKKMACQSKKDFPVSFCFL